MISDLHLTHGPGPPWLQASAAALAVRHAVIAAQQQVIHSPLQVSRPGSSRGQALRAAQPAHLPHAARMGKLVQIACAQPGPGSGRAPILLWFAAVGRGKSVWGAGTEPGKGDATGMVLQKA